MSGVIGAVIGLMIGILLGSIAYYTGWSKGWDDSKKFVFTELDKRNDEHIVLLVRGMAKELKGGQDDKS